MKRYFIDEDDSGHWYLVLADKRGEWEAWLETEDEDEMDAMPDFARRIGAPSWITFERPFLGVSEL